MFMPGRAAVVATLLAGTLPAGAAAQLVHGRVLDDASGQPVLHATLALVNDRDQVVASAEVDSTGAFRIRTWHAGKYLLRTTAVGYITVSSELMELATGDLLELTVRIAPDAIPLEAIVVKQRARANLAEIALAGYYDRRDAGRRLGLGRFFDRGAIARRGKRLTDVLATIPGVRVLRVANCAVPLISMAGNNATRLSDPEFDNLVRPSADGACNVTNVCRANVYIDGVQQSFDSGVSIDHTVPLDWIEAIEVYRRPSEIPAEFLSRATCGVVAVWTRRG